MTPAEGFGFCGREVDFLLGAPAEASAGAFLMFRGGAMMNQKIVAVQAMEILVRKGCIHHEFSEHTV
jgi:hypothetical protein